MTSNSLSREDWIVPRTLITAEYVIWPLVPATNADHDVTWRAWDLTSWLTQISKYGRFFGV